VRQGRSACARRQLVHNHERMMVSTKCFGAADVLRKKGGRVQGRRERGRRRSTTTLDDADRRRSTKRRPSESGAGGTKTWAHMTQCGLAWGSGRPPAFPFASSMDLQSAEEKKRTSAAPRPPGENDARSPPTYCRIAPCTPSFPLRRNTKQTVLLFKHTHTHHLAKMNKLAVLLLVCCESPSKEALLGASPFFSFVVGSLRSPSLAPRIRRPARRPGRGDLRCAAVGAGARGGGRARQAQGRAPLVLCSNHQWPLGRALRWLSSFSCSLSARAQ
jgi:hypothetical protein